MVGNPIQASSNDAGYIHSQEAAPLSQYSPNSNSNDNVGIIGPQYRQHAPSSYVLESQHHASHPYQPRYDSGVQTLQSFGSAQQYSPMNLEGLRNALPEYNYPQNFVPSSQPASGFSTMYGVSSNSPFASTQVRYFAQQQNSIGHHHDPRLMPTPAAVQPYHQYPQRPQTQIGAPFYYARNQQIGNTVHNNYQNYGRGFSQDVNHRAVVSQGPIGQGSAAFSSSNRSSGASSAVPASIPRGPPRKPKQSGHALWVGNLPQTANVVELKDHFSRGATEDILSVFLISKSNCAFVNYKTEASCSAAMIRFNDSKYRETKLVCRLRRAQPAGAPTGPAAASAPDGFVPAVVKGTTEAKNDGDETDRNAAQQGGQIRNLEPVTAQGDSSKPKASDRYFIVKSLTVEDLEVSVRNKQWATQSHNEETLNSAYATAKNVYLIFSANKSGEYFGYARMTSPVNEDPAAAIEFAPKAQASEDPEQLKSIPTDATEFAPRGRIIDDSARGTIFWEAETDEDDQTTQDDGATNTAADGGIEENSESEAEGVSKAWGKPFTLEWQSTSRLPFYKTRGLRNPWNSNREVKIARDGTELETSLGRRLVEIFHHETVQQQAPVLMAPMVPMVYHSHGQYQ